MSIHEDAAEMVQLARAEDVRDCILPPAPVLLSDEQMADMDETWGVA